MRRNEKKESWFFFLSGGESEQMVNRGMKTGKGKYKENIGRLLSLPLPSASFLPQCLVKNRREIGMESEGKFSLWLLERYFLC